ncbi:hypothetical protein D3C78_1425240 [compost metagenome]
MQCGQQGVVTGAGQLLAGIGELALGIQYVEADAHAQAVAQAIGLQGGLRGALRRFQRSYPGHAAADSQPGTARFQHGATAGIVEVRFRLQQQIAGFAHGRTPGAALEQGQAKAQADAVVLVVQAVTARLPLHPMAGNQIKAWQVFSLAAAEFLPGNFLHQFLCPHLRRVLPG